MPQCIVPGCNNHARHNIGIRVRKPSTRAIWAPNTDAYLCDEHATCGMDIAINMTPNSSGTISTHVSAGGHPISRTTPIQRAP